MPALHAADALLAEGWQRDVRIEWDDAGLITRVDVGAAPGDATRAHGPVVPGMANAHSHAFQRAMAGLAERREHPTDDFWTWREEMYRLVLALQPDDIEAIARHLYIEMLRHGYTAVAEFHYLHRDAAGSPYANRAELADRIIAAAGETGIALTFLPVLYAHGGFGHRALDPAQRRFASTPAELLEMLQELAAFHLPSPVMRFGVAPHSVRAVDALQLTELVDGITQRDATAPIHIHLSEQVREVSGCVETHGTTPFAWIRDLVDVDERWTFVHATHITDRERDAIASARATLALCPSTEANLGDGIFDLPAWIERRGSWTVGGDSHVSVSPFEELRMLEWGQRLRLRVRNVAATPDENDVASFMWRHAAAGGARALAQPAGIIAAGLRADLVVLDASAAQVQALAARDVLASHIFAGNPRPARDVFVCGRPVVQAGHHAGQDAAESAYRDCLRRLRGP
jgi:formimidoylglutamate deiminase